MKFILDCFSTDHLCPNGYIGCSGYLSPGLYYIVKICDKVLQIYDNFGKQVARIKLNLDFFHQQQTDFMRLLVGPHYLYIQKVHILFIISLDGKLINKLNFGNRHDEAVQIMISPSGKIFVLIGDYRFSDTSYFSWIFGKELFEYSEDGKERKELKFDMTKFGSRKVKLLFCDENEYIHLLDRDNERIVIYDVKSEEYVFSSHLVKDGKKYWPAIDEMCTMNCILLNKYCFYDYERGMVIFNPII